MQYLSKDHFNNCKQLIFKKYLAMNKQCITNTCDCLKAVTQMLQKKIIIMFQESLKKSRNELILDHLGNKKPYG